MADPKNETTDQSLNKGTLDKKEDSQQDKDLVLTTINGYLASKKYILDKMYYSLNPINEKKEVVHSNEPPASFDDYLKYYYGLQEDGNIKQTRGLTINGDLYNAIINYNKGKNNTKTTETTPPNNQKTDKAEKKQKNYNKKPDIFFISDIKAGYIGEAEPKGGSVSKNYNINYISLGFLIDKILNENIGIKMKPKDSNELIDIFNFVETPIKIVNSPYLISKNYSVCLIPQIHPYSTGIPGEIKESGKGIEQDGAKNDPKETTKISELIYDKAGTKLYSWKNTIWNIKINGAGENATIDENFIKEPEKDYVNLRYILLNEQWIVKLFNSGTELGKVLENIVNEIQAAVFGWWQLVVVADNVNNNIKIVDTRGDIEDRKQEGIFKFKLYEQNDIGETQYNSIIREVNIETQMSNTFALSAMYKQNELKEENKEEIAFNLSNSSFNNMWNPGEKIKYSDIFLNDIQIQKVNYDNPKTYPNSSEADQYLKFYDKEYKSVYVAEDK